MIFLVLFMHPPISSSYSLSMLLVVFCLILTIFSFYLITFYFKSTNSILSLLQNELLTYLWYLNPIAPTKSSTIDISCGAIKQTSRLIHPDWKLNMVNYILTAWTVKAIIKLILMSAPFRNITSIRNIKKYQKLCDSKSKLIHLVFT